MITDVLAGFAVACAVVIAVFRPAELDDDAPPAVVRPASLPVMPRIPVMSYPDALSPEGARVVAAAEALLADPMQVYLDLGDGDS